MKVLTLFLALFVGCQLPTDYDANMLPKPKATFYALHSFKEGRAWVNVTAKNIGQLPLLVQGEVFVTYVVDGKTEVAHGVSDVLRLGLNKEIDFVIKTNNFRKDEITKRDFKLYRWISY